MTTTPKCEHCQDTGWVPMEDPVVGALILTRCPRMLGGNMTQSVERWQPVGWDVLQAQATTLAKSTFVPTAYRNKPNDVLAAGLYGQEIGLGISAALSYIHVINGKPTLSAEGMVALVRSKGHSISGAVGPTVATVTGKRADTGDSMTVEWTKAMADRAELKSDTWKKFPEAMLWARAVSQLCRMLFPDVLLGLSYTPEEMDDIEVLDSRVIDTSTGEIAAPKLKKINAAGPNGTATIYVNEDADPTGPASERLLSQEEGERREMVAKLGGAAKALSDQARGELRSWLDEIGIGSTTKVNDYTLEQLHVVDGYFDTVLGAAF